MAENVNRRTQWRLRTIFAKVTRNINITNMYVTWNIV